MIGKKNFKFRKETCRLIPEIHLVGNISKNHAFQTSIHFKQITEGRK